jgi:hypothetical protein
MAVRRMTPRQAGILTASVLAADGLVHVYWATGATWPMADAASLSRVVLNAEVPFTPRVLLPLAGVLFLASLLVLAQVRLLGRLGRALPESLPQLGTLAVAVGTLLRGIAGLVWALGIGSDPGTPFYRLNLAAYTPVCLVLFAAALAAARPTAPRTCRRSTTGTRGA